MWRLGLAAALLVCLGPGWAQNKPAPNVLFLHGAVFSTRMTWDYLQQFDDVVVLDFPMIEKHEDQKAEVRATEQLLARFVSEGGRPGPGGDKSIGR